MSQKKKEDESKDKVLLNPIEENELHNNPKLPEDEESLAIESPKWINNQGNEVKEVFGFNENAELINARAAMFGFIMLLITELVFGGVPVTHTIFGIG